MPEAAPNAPASAPNAPTSNPNFAPPPAKGAPPTQAAANDNGGERGAQAPSGEAGQPADAGGVLELSSLGELGQRLVRIEKVNGEVVEIPLAKALENARLGTAAFRKLDEAAAMRKEAEKVVGQVKSFVQTLDNDPLAVIRKRGQAVEKRLYDQIRAELEREAMPADQRRLAEMDDRDRTLADRERRLHEMEQRRQHEERERAIEAVKEQRKAELSKQFGAALTSAGLDAEDHPEGMARMVDLIVEAKRRGVRLDPEDAARIATQEIEGRFQSRLKRKNVPALVETLDETQRAALQHHTLSGLQRAPANGNGARPAPKQSKGPEMPASDSMSRDEFKAFLDRRSRGG